MNVDTIKIELIDWIARLKDPLLIGKLLEIKNKVNERKAESKVYGSGKYLIEFIAEDFNEPVDDFRPYQQ